MGDMFKGDSKAIPIDVATAQQIQALTKGLPGLIGAINSQATPTAQANLAAQKAVSPQEQALNAQLYQQFSPVYAEQNAKNELSNLKGAGGQSVLAANDLNKTIDPEYYATRATSASKLQDLMNNPISGSESASIERANNAGQIGNGTFGLDTNATQLGAAMNFGSAGRDRLGQALGMATQSIPTFKSGVDAFGQATGRTGTQGGIAQNQIGAVNNGNSVGGTANSLLGNIGSQQGIQTNVDANRRTVFDAVNQSYSAAGTGTTGGCCFIFLEAYHGKLPWSVRQYRDLVYSLDPTIATGYVRMARYLVPLMKRFACVRSLVWNLMVCPLTQYGNWFYGLSTVGEDKAIYKSFWLTTWKLIGRIY